MYCFISCSLFFSDSTRQNQLILLDTLDQEVTKFREFNALLDLNSLVCGISICTHYTSNLQGFKLVVLRAVYRGKGVPQ